MHMTETVWSSSIREQDRNLMASLWTQRDKIPEHVWVLKMGGWISLLGMDEAWEQDWIADKEDWSVISDYIS
jgi:hypothetical protein